PAFMVLDSGGAGHVRRIVFFSLELAGLAGAVIMLLTGLIWRQAARRHIVWFNFMFTWMISCASYILLIGQSVDELPNRTICVAQSALIYSVPTLTSGSTLALVIHVYITLRTLLTVATPDYLFMYRKILTIMLVGVPYVPTAGMFASALVISLRAPPSELSLSYSEGAFCGLTATPLGRISASIVAVMMIAGLVFEAVIFCTLRRVWRTLQAENRASVSMITRVMAFTLVSIVSIIISMIFLVLPSEHQSGFNVMIATIPVTSVLIFGTQKDVLNAWASIFRKKRAHGADTWDTFTPEGSRQIIITLSPLRSKV
ncbi:unnamed protein product, partial [Mycena citricolor]